MPLTILKIVYWILNVGIIYIYFLRREVIFSQSTPFLVTVAVLWIVLSVIYGYYLARYLMTKGKEGTCM